MAKNYESENKNSRNCADTSEKNCFGKDSNSAGNTKSKNTTNTTTSKNKTSNKTSQSYDEETSRY